MSVSTEEDVMRIKKRLEKMMKSNDIDVKVSMDMLNTLKKLQIDFQILKATGIGVVLNNLRKSCNSEELGSLAKNLLKNWKKLVAVETAPADNSPNSNSNDSPTQSSRSPSTPSTTNGNGL
ncbi:transcription elongation factor S-II-like, partial [Brachionus plicatilis]